MFGFVKGDIEFFKLFNDSIANIVQGALELKRMMEDFDNAKQSVKRIKEIEHIGDNITHSIVKKLNKTFVTPFDREDIYKLASSLDDIIDLIDAASSRIILYRVDKPTTEAKQLAFLIFKSTEELQKSITNLGKKGGEVYHHCVEVNSLENEADNVCRDAIADLFQDIPDPITIIKWKEIYETLETATDRCEDAANILESIILKNA